MLRACLESIEYATTSDVAITVVDNLTTDSTVRDVVARFPHVRFLETGANLGYGRAVNYAVDRADDSIEWILVTNPDTVFLPGAIDTLYEAATANDTIGSIGPRILDTDGTIYPSARALPSLRTGIGHALLAHVWPNNPWSARYRQSRAVETMTGGTMTAGWLSGACVMVRRTALTDVGGFDDRYFMYFEDVQLGDSLGRAGWSNVYIADAQVSHIGGHSTRLRSNVMRRVHHESAYTYLSGKYSAWYLAPVRAALWTGIRARVALMNVKNPGR